MSRMATITSRMTSAFRTLSISRWPVYTALGAGAVAWRRRGMTPPAEHPLPDPPRKGGGNLYREQAGEVVGAWSALSGFVIPFFDGRPVDGVPPGGHVVRALVLILQVIGVLPDVDAHDRHAALRDGVVLVREAADRELVARQVEPAPTTAELPDGRLRKGVLEGREVPKGLVDRLRQLLGGLAAAIGAHDLPEDRVVEVAAPV